MPLLTLFKSKATRDAEARMRFRRGKGRVQKYVKESRDASAKYWQLALEAYRLGDTEQFKIIAAHYLRLQSTEMRWKRFLVKLEALELRRNEVSVSQEFLVSISELTTAINREANPEDIARMQVDIERAIEKSKAQEEMLDVAMEATGVSFEGNSQGDELVLAEVEKSVMNALKQRGAGSSTGFFNSGQLEDPSIPDLPSLENEVLQMIEKASNSRN